MAGATVAFAASAACAAADVASATTLRPGAQGGQEWAGAIDDDDFCLLQMGAPIRHRATIARRPAGSWEDRGRSAAPLPPQARRWWEPKRKRRHRSVARSTGPSALEKHRSFSPNSQKQPGRARDNAFVLPLWTPPRAAHTEVPSRRPGAAPARVAPWPPSMPITSNVSAFDPTAPLHNVTMPSVKDAAALEWWRWGFSGAGDPQNAGDVQNGDIASALHVTARLRQTAGHKVKQLLRAAWALSTFAAPQSPSLTMLYVVGLTLAMMPLLTALAVSALISRIKKSPKERNPRRPSAEAQAGQPCASAAADGSPAPKPPAPAAPQRARPVPPDPAASQGTGTSRDAPGGSSALQEVLPEMLHWQRPISGDRGKSTASTSMGGAERSTNTFDDDSGPASRSSAQPTPSPLAGLLAKGAGTPPAQPRRPPPGAESPAPLLQGQPSRPPGAGNPPHRGHARPPPSALSGGLGSDPELTAHR